MKKIRIIAILLIIVFINLQIFSEQPGTDEVINKYLQSMKTLDYEKMINCFAFSDYVDNYDFSKIAVYVGWINLKNQLLPNKYDIYKKINTTKRLSVITAQIEGVILKLCIKDPKILLPIKIKEPNDINNLMDKLNPEILSGLKIIKIVTPYSKKDLPKMKEVNEKQAKMSGALDGSERLALVQISDKYYIIPFRLLKYSKGWYIESLQSYYTNFVNIKETTISEFNDNYTE